MKVAHGRASILAIALLSMVATACLLKLSFAQNGQPAGDGPHFFLVSYDETVITDPTQRQLYQSLADVLNGWQQIPNDRLNYYSAVDNQNGYAITGWQGIITTVQPNNNGYSVTVSITPTLTTDAAGSQSVPMTADYSEVFQVNHDNTFQYTGFLDPQRLAGHLPDIADL